MIEGNATSYSDGYSDGYDSSLETIYKLESDVSTLQSRIKELEEQRLPKLVVEKYEGQLMSGLGYSGEQLGKMAPTEFIASLKGTGIVVSASTFDNVIDELMASIRVQLLHEYKNPDK